MSNASQSSDATASKLSARVVLSFFIRIQHTLLSRSGNAELTSLIGQRLYREPVEADASLLPCSSLQRQHRYSACLHIPERNPARCVGGMRESPVLARAFHTVQAEDGSQGGTHRNAEVMSAQKLVSIKLQELSR